MKTASLALVLALVSGSVACSGNTGVPSSTAQTAKAKAPLAVQVSGPLRGIADSFADVPLRPEQRTMIESELKTAEDRHSKLRPMAKEIALLVADQIEKGTLDETVLQPKIDAAIAAFKPVRDEDRKAIQRAHDLLDADQRAQLVDVLDTKHKVRWGKHRDGKGGFPQIAEELGLTPEQKTKLFEIVRDEALTDGSEPHLKGWSDRWEMNARMTKAREAFKTDAFKIDDAAPAMDLDKGSKQMLEHGIRIAKLALPILTPEQRATAAKIIRERAETFGELH